MRAHRLKVAHECRSAGPCRPDPELQHRRQAVRDDRRCPTAWPVPVIVVIDGSTDGTGEALTRMTEGDPALFACVLPRNQGKGEAVLHGLRLAQRKGFTHALTMDADGQHSTAHVGEMIAVSLAHPAAMVLGLPVFDGSAPRIRLFGHKIANFCTGLVTPARRDRGFAVRISRLSDRSTARDL